MDRAFLLAGCVSLLIFVRYEVAESWPSADESLLLKDAHRLGDCLPGMPMLMAQCPDGRELCARGEHAAGDLVTHERGELPVGAGVGHRQSFVTGRWASSASMAVISAWM